MRYLHLVWSNLGRKKIRTILTLLSIFIAFVLYGLLTAIKTAFGLGVDIVGVDRLLMLHKVSIIQPLPISYQSRIEATEGVDAVTHATWFGGVYKDPKLQFGQHPVEPEAFLEMYPEFLLPEDQKEAWLANRTGAIVGRKTAERFGWEVGDRIPIQGVIYRRDDGSAWEFDIEGIYDGKEKATDTTLFLFHRKYFEESVPQLKGYVGWYVIRVDDPDSSAEIAERIDAQFANSPAETKTATEKAFIQGFANQMGNIQAIVTGVLSVVFFTLLLVAGNTVAQSVRERTNELAVLKTLGFSDRQVMALVLAESCLMATLGGALGIAAVWALTTYTDIGGNFLPVLYIPPNAVAAGFALVALLGLVTGAIPAWQGLKLDIVDALRRG